jgi:4-diphosphocytidyl-2-C-methyl-D-erythritol kinase
MRLRAYAKINLDLRILNLRPDGYHDISTVFQTIAMHDLVTVEPHDGPLSCTCDDPHVPGGEGNLALKAVRALWAACAREGEPRGIRVHIEKHVPMAAGLGGGSADAAAVLEAMARLWGMAAEDPRLRAAAVQVGADVPFFLLGGTALGTGRGDDLVALRDARPLEVVVVRPPSGIHTADAYRWYDDLLVARLPDTVVASIREGRVLSCCRNQLERPVTLRRPEIAGLCTRLRVRHARHAAMSGSGSAVFGLYETAALADAAADAMAQPGHLVVRTRFVGHAEYGRSRVVEDPRPERVTGR